MVVQTKLSILDILDLNIEGVHLRKLTQEVHGSFPNVRRFVNLLVDEGIVKTEQKGNLLNIKLKDSFSTLAYLKFVHTSRFLSLPDYLVQGIRDCLQDLEYKPLICLIVGDSKELKDKLKKSEAIEILFVFQDLEKNKNQKIKKSIKDSIEKTKLKIKPNILDYNEFKNKFIDKSDKFFNNLISRNIIITGIDYYYSLLWRFLK